MHTFHYLVKCAKCRQFDSIDNLEPARLDLGSKMIQDLRSGMFGADSPPDAEASIQKRCRQLQPALC